MLQSGEGSWQDPLPVGESLLPVQPFDPLMLPDALQTWVTDIAERTQVPIDYVAVSAIVAISSVIGRQVVIRPKKHDSWTVTPNLWGLCIGPPGSMKSPAQAEALAPIYKLQQKAMEEYRRLLKEYSAARDADADKTSNNATGHASSLAI